MTSRSGVFVMGESLIDVVHGAGGAESSFPGGSPLNVATGLARLGVPVRFHTAVGADAFGAEVLAHLAENGVSFSQAASVVAEKTAVAHAWLDQAGSARYSFEITWRPRRAAIGTASLLHVGSISTLLQPGAAAVADLLARVPADVVVTFDPNIRPAITPDVDSTRRQVEALIGRAHVVKASEEDAAFLYPHEELSRVATRWRNLGAEVVVITRGPSGCVGWAGESEVEVNAWSPEVVDTIGAGDSFMAGLIAGIQALGARGHQQAAEDPSTLKGLLEFASACAGVTVSRHGANPPCRGEVPELQQFS